MFGRLLCHIELGIVQILQYFPSQLPAYFLHKLIWIKLIPMISIKDQTIPLQLTQGPIGKSEPYAIKFWTCPGH